jgi:peptide/nickel transport system substrate-binding protein
LQDKRVREALSLALDRKAIVDRIMGGVALPAGNFLPYPSFGTSKELANAPAANVPLAKKLLAEAGYPKGFAMSLGSASGRWVNDKNVAQAIASMWARIGIKVDVQTMAPPVYFTQRNDHAFSTWLSGWAANSGEMINPLNALVVTLVPEQGLGTANRSYYSNPELDKLVMEASQTLDDAKRSELLQQAAQIAMSDYAALPVHFESSVWAMKKDIRYAGRSDQMTLAQDITLAK